MRRLLIITLFSFATITLPSLALAQQIIHLPNTTATIECYAVESAKEAVVVCPGGSYYWLDYKHEGVEVAKWLQKEGYSAYVLRYHVAGWWAWATHYRLLFRGLKPWEPMHDTEAAIAYLKDSLGISQVGIIGFSAGGHLAVTAALNNLGYSWAAAIYPVVSMQAPCTHRRSRRALLGERSQNNLDMQKQYSLESQIHSKCPPVFLVACKDDPIVDHHNSELLDSALTAKHVPHRFLLYNTGGHGFAVRVDKGSPECHAWEKEFLDWLRLRN